MVFAVLIVFLIGGATGAAVDNQYPVVGETITGQEQAGK